MKQKSLWKLIAFLIVATLTVLITSKAHGNETASMVLSGKPGQDPVVQMELARHDYVIINDRLPLDHPGFFEEMDALNPDIEYFVLFSVTEVWPNWEAHSVPDSLLTYRMGEWLTQHRAWLPAAEQPPRKRGAEPALFFWGAMMNMAHPDLPRAWARLVWENHQRLEQVAGRKMNILVDSVLDKAYWITQMDNNLGLNPDYNKDGAPDSADEFNRVWRDGVGEALLRLREYAGDRLIIGNGDNTQTRYLNGRVFERFSSIGAHSPAQDVLWLEAQADLGWVEPTLHFVGGDDLRHAFAVTLVSDQHLVVMAQDYWNGDSYIPEFDGDYGTKGSPAAFSGGWITRPYLGGEGIYYISVENRGLGVDLGR